MDDVKRLANALRQPSISNSPRSNKVAGFFADALKPVQQFASGYSVPESVPLVGGQSMADLTGLTGAQGLLDEVSYGYPVVRGGSFQTSRIDPRVLDVAGLAPTGAGLVKGAKLYGKTLAKEIGRNINEGTAIGNLLDPRMNMIAYHGSPHSFDKFDMSKIGTGEGAQAYGHGLYFADSPEVAKEYQLALGNKPAAVDDFAGFEAQAAMAKNKGHVKNSIAWLENRKKTIDEAKQFLIPGAHEKQIADIDEAIRRISSGEVNKNNGTLYKVDIADEAIPNMLLWDKPLSEQPKAIQDEIKRIGGSASNGAEAYKELMFQARMEGIKSDKSSLRNNVEQLAASKRLKELGIPGIRYLDANSRGQGAGTMNTVLFDENLVKILEKNGKPVGAK